MANIYTILILSNVYKRFRNHFKGSVASMILFFNTLTPNYDLNYDETIVTDPYFHIEILTNVKKTNSLFSSADN